MLMEDKYFIWNGVNSKDMSIIVSELPDIEASLKKYEYKNGSIKDNGYSDSIPRNVMCYFDINTIEYSKIFKWLNEEGEISFSNYPDVYYKAFLNNRIAFKEYIENEIDEIPLMFECESKGYLISGKNKITLTETKTITNLGNIEAEPVITIFGSGDIDLIIGQQVIQLKGVNGSITLDTPILETYKGGELQNKKVNGEFPVLPEGTFSFLWSGTVTSVEIIPNWRCL